MTKTLEEVLKTQGVRVNRTTLEAYIRREWVRPLKKESSWMFEDIDIARLQLVSHLVQDMEVDEEAMDVVLSLLDQVYGLRARMRRLSRAITRQPEQVQAEIMSAFEKMLASD